MLVSHLLLPIPSYPYTYFLKQEPNAKSHFASAFYPLQPSISYPTLCFLFCPLATPCLFLAKEEAAIKAQSVLESLSLRSREKSKCRVWFKG